MYKTVKQSIYKTKKSKTQLMCLDLETMTIHNVLEIDYYEKKVVMENDECGCTSNNLNKVLLLTEL